MASILRFSIVSSGGVIDTTEKKKFINFVIFVNSIGSFNPKKKVWIYEWECSNLVTLSLLIYRKMNNNAKPMLCVQNRRLLGAPYSWRKKNY